MKATKNQPPRLPSVFRPLSEAELRLLKLYTTRMRLWEIADHLGLAYNTLKNQSRALFFRLDVTNRGEAVWEGIVRGLLHTPRERWH